MKFILIKFNVKSLRNKRYKRSEYIIISIFLSGYYNRAVLIKYKIYIVYSLSVSILISIMIMKPENNFLYYKSDTIITGSYYYLKPLIIITLKGEKVLVAISSMKNTIISLRVYLAMLIGGVKLRLLL